MFAGEDVAKGQDERSKDCEEQASFAKGRVRFSDGVSRWFEGNAQTASETLSAGQSQQKAKNACLSRHNTEHGLEIGHLRVELPRSYRLSGCGSPKELFRLNSRIGQSLRRPRNGPAAARLDAGPASVSGWERLVDFSRCRPGHFKCSRHA